MNGNVAPHAGGGGIQNLLGTATLNHSQVNGNTSLNGGGIASGNQGNPSATAELKLNHTRVNGNTATAGPGGEGPPVAAGGIANGSVAVLNHSRVDRNHAPSGLGAGIVNHGMMTLKHSEVNRNTAAASGFAGSGGGILNAEGPPGTTPAVLTLDHSRVNGNSAGGYGGGIANGVPLPPSPPPLIGGEVTLKHSQVKHNSAGARRRHLQQRRHRDAAGVDGHRQSGGQLRADGHHRRLYQLTSTTSPLEAGPVPRACFLCAVD